ncbi:hypothetical protein [Methylobacterium sp. NFXW15]|uniref:hypothetical protein n=1 Tax=Methylobacterium sp. NFXW15 TaxID=2819512 RepID=UPI003CF1F216
MSNRIPSHILRHIMVASWKDARREAKLDGELVRAHLAAAMRFHWKSARMSIITARREAAELVSLPVIIPAVVTSAVSERQMAYAQEKVALQARFLAKGFARLRETLGSDEDRAMLDKAVAAFKGASARFWLDLQTGDDVEQFAQILTLRAGGFEIPAGVFMPDRIRLADSI